MSLGKWGSGAEVLRVRRFGVEGSAWGFRDLHFTGLWSTML